MSYTDSHYELIPLHSPLLGESLLVSFPPLNNMLKFRGSSRFIWDLIQRQAVGGLSPHHHTCFCAATDTPLLKKIPNRKCCAGPGTHKAPQTHNSHFLYDFLFVSSWRRTDCSSGGQASGYFPVKKNDRLPQLPMSHSARSVWRTTQWRLVRTDTQRGVVSGLSQNRNLRSKIWWFTEFCNSHYVSHFAAFFIVTRTKISVAKSCSYVS